MCGIYSALTPDNQMYVGQTTKRLSTRVANHRYRARTTCSDVGIGGAINRFGSDVVWGWIVQDAPYPTLNVLEEWYILIKGSYVAGLNLTPYAVEYHPKHGDYSDEERLRISERNSGTLNPMYGKQHSIEAKTKIASARKIACCDPVEKARMSELSKTANVRSVIVDGIRFNKVSDAYAYFGICSSTFYNWKNGTEHTIEYVNNNMDGSMTNEEGKQK